MSRKITNEELSTKAPKDELLMYYSSHKFFDTCAHFEMTYNQMNRLFQYYNISKRTHEEAFELPKSTCEQKYGNSTFTNRSKAEQTMLKRFGVKYAGQSAELLEKQQNTCLQRYGVKTPMENREIAQRNRNNHINKNQSYFSEKSIYNWCRQYEFPYPNISDEICRKSYQSLIKSDMTKFSMKARYGDKIISKYHKSLWRAHLKNKKSIYDAWQDDNLLKSCIKNRIIYKGNDLDPSKVLAGFNYSKIAPKVSIFNANLAKYLIWKYLNEFDTIFDPFSGFSGRLLGTTSLDKKYIGNDINSDVIKESQQIINDLSLDAQLTNLNTEELKGNYPCLITCPPYSDKEQWFGTAVSKYSCDDWIDICLDNFDCEKYL